MEWLKPHSEAARKLLALSKFGAGIGLHRMAWISERLPDPTWLRRPAVLAVTGSKGKGSTSGLCAAILRELGFNTGLYSSPHLVRFNERINLNGVEVSDADLAAAWGWFEAEAQVYEAAFPGDRFGAFEAMTAVASWVFSQHNVEALVVEAGIGGRYDATRSLGAPTVILTSVELEHTELLGRTTELIAYDKADLCPTGGTLILGRLTPDLVRRLKAYGALRPFKVVDVSAESEIRDIKWLDRRMEFSLNCLGLSFGKVTTPLLGEHQAGNAAAAILAVWDWLQRHRPQVTKEDLRMAVHRALATFQYPGRLQIVHQNPEVIIDVGHTPESVRLAARAIRALYPSTPRLLVTGVSTNKDIDGVLRELLPLADSVICTRAWHMGTEADEIARRCRRLRPDLSPQSAPAIEPAMAIAIARARDEGMVVVVAGGLFLAIEAWATIQGLDPRGLEFA